MTKMFKHTATFSDGTVVVKNFKKVFPFAKRSINTQKHYQTGEPIIQTQVGFSTSPAASHLLRGIGGVTTTEVVRTVVE